MMPVVRSGGKRNVAGFQNEELRKLPIRCGLHILSHHSSADLVEHLSVPFGVLFGAKNTKWEMLRKAECV